MSRTTSVFRERIYPTRGHAAEKGLNVVVTVTTVPGIVIVDEQFVDRVPKRK